MIYNDEYTFQIKNEQKSTFIRIPRNKGNNMNDVTATELYKEVENDFNIYNDFILKLNEKIIPCSSDFQLSFLQYLPFQQIIIIIEKKSDKQSNIKLGKEKIKVSYDEKEFCVSDKSQMQDEYDPQNFKKIFDLKKKFAEDISNYGKTPVNPYELIISTEDRYVGDDENVDPIYRKSKLIISRRFNGDALYPLLFKLGFRNEKDEIKKWYNKDTTFGQIAFDLFGDKYYEYTFKLDPLEEYSRSFNFSSKVDEIKIPGEGNYRILNHFIIEQNNDQYFHFSFLNFIKGKHYRNGNFQFSYIYNNKIEAKNSKNTEDNDNERMCIYNIQKKISADISKNIKCDHLLLDKKINLRAKISDYGDPYVSYNNTQLIYGQPRSNIFKVYFYNEKKYEIICMKDFSTIFDLRYYISVNHKVNFENVLILQKKVDGFNFESHKHECLDNSVILTSAYSDHISYIAVITSNENSHTYIDEQKNNINVSKSEDIQSNTEPGIPIVKAKSDSDIGPKNYPYQTNSYEAGILNKTENQQQQQSEQQQTTNQQQQQSEQQQTTNQQQQQSEQQQTTNQQQQQSEQQQTTNQQQQQSENGSKVVETAQNEFNSGVVKTSETYLNPALVNGNEHQKKKLTNKQISKLFKPKIVKMNNEETSKTPNDSQTENPKSMNKEVEKKVKPIKYLQLNFEYNDKKFEFLHPPDKDKDIKSFESKIRRLFKINSQIDFFKKNSSNKNINDLKLSDINEPLTEIDVCPTGTPLDKSIYYTIYGKPEEYKLNGVKNVGELKNRISEEHNYLMCKKISIVFGGKILEDDTNINRLYSTEDSKIILTAYNNKSIIDFSGTVNLDKILISTKK